MSILNVNVSQADLESARQLVEGFRSAHSPDFGVARPSGFSLSTSLRERRMGLIIARQDVRVRADPADARAEIAGGGDREPSLNPLTSRHARDTGPTERLIQTRSALFLISHFFLPGAR